jgi:alpha-glucosidase
MDNSDMSKLLIAVIASLRGTAFIYQGEELGLSEAVIPFEQLQDPWGITLYPEWQGRDGCRTPMPWNDTRYAGFSTTKTWLPIPDDHKPLSVKRQEKNLSSSLHFTRMLMRWRKNHPVFRNGEITFIGDPHAETLAFERHNADSRILCLFNFSAEPRTVTGIESHWKTMVRPGVRDFESIPAPEGEITLAPWGFAYFFAES